MKQGLLFWGGYVSFICILGVIITHRDPEPVPIEVTPITLDSIMPAPIAHDTIHDTIYIEPEIVFVTDTVYIPVPIIIPTSKLVDTYRNLRQIERRKSNPNIYNGDA